MSLPTSSTPGYTSFPTIWGARTCCTCVAQWLPVYARKLGVSTDALRVTQLTGGASASAGTHGRGGAIDLLSTNREWVRVAREMGAAAWVRRAGFSTPHIHMVLNGCPHNAPARYQITALANGRNGLANNGADDGPGPRQLRTWQAGIAWAGGSGGFLMALSDKQQDDLYRWTREIVIGMRDVRPGRKGEYSDGTLARWLREVAQKQRDVHQTLMIGGVVRTIISDLRSGRKGRWTEGPGYRKILDTIRKK